MNPFEARWRELGLWPRWLQRGATGGQTPISGSDPKPVVQRPVAVTQAVTPWSALQMQIDGCTQCTLHQSRQKTVMGSGDHNAKWLFVGEGPGAEENTSGKPFVGQAGQLLDQMLQALGLQREVNVYLTNVVKCAPPQNRSPNAQECRACLPFLQQQIALIQPKVIVALGKVAAQSLLGVEGALSALREQEHRLGDVPVVVTWHPSYLIRSPADKARSWEDLCRARVFVR
jgi:uracil-DNA glycosylase family 4